MNDWKSELRQVCRKFQVYGELVHARPLNTGHINRTYIATYDQGGTRVRYVHQKLNGRVFPRPLPVMKNIQRVTAHLRWKLEQAQVPDLTRRALTLIPTRDGEPCCRQGRGGVWRTFVYVKGTRADETVRTPAQAFQAGRAFGEFQALLLDLPGGRLSETLPDFHNTRKRFDAFRRAVAADICNRASGARADIDFALRRESMVEGILDALARGEIPERITHNDAKFNNVLLDRATGEAMCIVDLDTVMPGCALYDFGDLVRTATSPTLEDELDLGKLRMQMPFFKALVRGYMSAAGRFLNRREKELTAFSGKLITFETGLRFLTDYLAGDVYFRTHRESHNLDRCRAQFKLVQSIERQEAAMQRYVDGL